MMLGPQSRTTFGSVCLEDLGMVVERVHDDAPAVDYVTTDVPGRHGNVLQGHTLGPREITLECRAFRRRWHDFEALKDELAALLLHEGESKLVVRNHPGEHYMAHLTSITEGDRIGGTGIGYVELAFTASDPFRYGRRGSVTVPSGGSVTFLVRGTVPATVSVSAPSAVRQSASGAWGVRFDEGDFLHVAIPVSTASTVAIDCADRSVTVNGATSMVTLDSDWPSLAPGSHVARMDLGTGAATVTWQERSV